MRTHYWTCSKFADWLRGTPKPRAADSKGWRDWENLAKGTHKFRYWLAEEGLDRLQEIVYFVPDKIYSIKYYINNRWVTRTHSLTAHPRDIKPGNWYDVGNRFLPCLFNELVNFVEVELAWWHIAWTSDKELRKTYNVPFWAKGWFRWRTWRCAQAGLDNLNWQRALLHDDEYCKGDEPYYLQPTPQAIQAQEILDLYNWWTKERPLRPDPYDASGWSKYCEMMRKKHGDGLLAGFDSEDVADRAERDRSHQILGDLEKIYEDEDEAMMIRLIKVRNGLWT